LYRLFQANFGGERPAPSGVSSEIEQGMNLGPPVVTDPEEERVQTLAISAGCPVYTAHDARIGDVHRVVIDAITDDVTHIVVRKGVFFTQDRVIPIDSIATASTERVNLDVNLVADELPRFETASYVPYEDAAPGGGDPPFGSEPLVHYRPYGTFRSFPPVTMRRVVERNIPDRAVALRAGASVVDKDGRRVGTFQEMVATQSGVPTHLVVDLQGLITSLRAVPIEWVAVIAADKVELGVTGGLVEAVQEYREDRAEA